MIFRPLFTFFLCICNLPVIAQVTNVVFIGSAMVKGGDSYPFKLNVTDSNGILTGYSITDILGSDETKTSIYGRINPQKKTVTFAEQRIIYTKSAAASSDFCFIHANLKQVTLQGASSLRGTFKGYKEDGKTECASGKMVLVCAQDVLDKIMAVAEKDSTLKKKLDSAGVYKHPAIVYERDVAENDVKKVSPGGTLTLTCPSDNISVDLWDFRTIDGDRISLYQDGLPLIENHTLSGTHKVIKLDLEGHKTTTLHLVALNEGSEPLNTARIRITSGTQEFMIDAATTVARPVDIVINVR